MNQINPMSRRELLRRLAVAGVAIPGLPAVLAACGSSSTTSAAGTTAPSGTDAPVATEPSATTADTKPADSKQADTKVGAATLTGTLNFLNFVGWAGKGTYASFSTAFPGAKVNEVPWQSADDSIAKAKGRSGDIDLLLVDGTTFPALVALDVLAEFGDAVPNLKNIDKEFTSKSWDPTNTRFAATDYGRTGFAYRKDLVKETPTSWADFYKIMGNYKGKVGLLDYQRSVMGSILTSLSLNPSSKDPADLKAVAAKLAEIKPNLLALAVEPGKQLVSGDLVMAWADAYDIYSAQQKDPNIVWVDPSEGQVAYLEGLAVLKGPREELAKAYVNFALDQAQYADFINTVTSPGVMSTNEKINEALRTSPVLNPSADVRSRIVFHDVLGDAQELWQTTWDAFKAA
jgi:spermidine/putrescine transport system substrate-binding protein